MGAVIPYEIPIFLYIPIAALIMMNRDSAKGFTLAYLIAVLALPANVFVEINFFPPLGRGSAANIGIFLGTLLFHPEKISRFRFQWFDALLLASLPLLVVSSLLNGLGAYDGFSRVLNECLGLMLTIYLVRIHLDSLRAVSLFLRYLVYSSVILAVLALYEFRMSPQIHYKLYGYFQHVFAQHKRGGFYRPVICFSHGLALGRFFAFTAFMAMLPMRKELGRTAPMGQLLFLAPLLGLLLSMSYGPYFIFALLCGMYVVCRRAMIFAYALPAVAFTWLALMFMGIQPAQPVVNAIASINPTRAASLEYRLAAIDEYRTVVLSSPIYGHGKWGRGRIESRATDSVFLVSCLSDGLVTTSLVFAWWLILMHRGFVCAKRLRKTPYFDPVFGCALMMPIAIAICSIDAALDAQVVVLASALLATGVALHKTRFLPSRRLAPVGRGGAVPYRQDRPVRAARMALRVHEAKQRRPEEAEDRPRDPRQPHIRWGDDSADEESYDA